MPDKFQNPSGNNKIDSSEREIAVNAQHMINMIRLRNHAGHPSKAKQRSDAHLMTIENTFEKIYNSNAKKSRNEESRKGICDYKKWEDKYTEYWATSQNKILREQVVTDDTELQQTSNIPTSPKCCKTAIKEIIKKHTLDDTQASVIQELMTDASKSKQNLMLLHGGPGTGKTHLIAALTE